MSERAVLLKSVQQYADGLATAVDVNRLQTLQCKVIEARREFRHDMRLDAELARLGNGSGLSPPSRVSEPRGTTDLQSFTRSLAWIDGLEVRRTKSAPGRRQLTRSHVTLYVVIITGAIWVYCGSTPARATVFEGGCGVNIESGEVSRPALAGDLLRHWDVISMTGDCTISTKTYDGLPVRRSLSRGM